jgi:hypothetical protein
VDSVLAARIAGLVVAAGAAALAVLGHYAPAIVLGVLALAMVVAAVGPAPAADASLATVAGLLQSLELKGDAHHVATRQGVRLFVPAEPGPVEVPQLEGADGIHRSTPHAIGIAVPHLGAHLEGRWSQLDRLPRGGGLPAAAHAIKRALPGLGLAPDVQVAARGARIRIRYPAAASCAESRAIGLHPHAACPSCALAAGLVARATARPVRLVSTTTEGDDTILTLEVVAGSPQPA